MSNLNNSQPPSPPPVDHYDFVYEDEIHDLAILMAHDQREHWTPMLTVDADETINQPKLTYLKEHIAALQEEYALLSKTSKALATTGKNWMIDAAKHPAEVRALHREKFTKLREDHDVPTVESKAKDKLAAFKDEIKKHKDLYCAARSILLQRTAVSKRRKADQSDQSRDVADVNPKGVAAEDDQLRSSVDAAPDLYGQPNFVTDVSLQGSVTDRDKLGSSTDAAPDQSHQCYIEADKKSQTCFTESDAARDQNSQPITVRDAKLPPSNEAGDSTDAAVGKYGQSNGVTVLKLQGATGRESKVIADGNIQDFFDEHEVRGSADAAADQYDQFEDQSPDSANQFIKAATNCLANIANLGRADTTGRSLEELEEKLPPDLRREVFRRRSRDRPWDIRKLEAYLLEVVDLFHATDGDKDLPRGADATKAFTQRCSSPLRPWARPFKTTPTPACNKPSKTHSAKLEPVYQDLNEPSSGSEPDNIGPDQNVEGSEGFDDATKDTQTKNTGTYAIRSNKENGAHRTTLLECVKVTVGHPTDKSQQCETGQRS
ncbi:hypothetical protein AAVH_18148 [Aphelenchoides avenae]|nr:hypothetical protein AAVH_18148 [Aphelenchus avenae]